MSKKSKNLYKRKDGRWEGRFIKARTPDGKAVYGSVYAHSYREAVQKLHLAVDCLGLPAPEPPLSAEGNAPAVFCILAEGWLQAIRPRVKDSTYIKYRNMIHAYLIPEFGRVALDDLSPQFINERCNHLLTVGGAEHRGLSAKTVSDLLSLIRNVLRYAELQGLRPPCTGTEISIKQTAKTMRVLSRAEQETLTRYLCLHPTRQNLGILLCLFTGLRIGELCALRWEDISFSERTIQVCRTMQRLQTSGSAGPRTAVVVTPPKSSSSVRTIPLPEGIFRLLNAAPRASGFFLTGRESVFIEPRTIQNHFRRAQQACGLEPVNFHTLRHTFATRCVETGFDVKSLSEILGHASVSITMNRYVHPSMELKKENMQRMSELFPVP